jgi:hypothetical protein
MTSQKPEGFTDQSGQSEASAGFDKKNTKFGNELPFEGPPSDQVFA